ncbi:MAG: DUF3710 domain-containing protein [Micrococcaceae bacterium]
MARSKNNRKSKKTRKRNNSNKTRQVRREIKPDRTIANFNNEQKGPAPRDLDFLYKDDEIIDEEVPKHAPADRAENGPFDISEIKRNPHEADCGSIVLPEMPIDFDVRMDIDQMTNRIISLSFDDENSSLQVQAFAAPKSEGVWLEIKKELAQSAVDEGGTAEPVTGTFGEELLVSIPAQLPDGTPAIRAARFVGVDGPRWFLRGAFSGPAAVDSELAKPLETLFRNIAVDRGENAMPPKELLPLRVPEGSLENPFADQGTANDGAAYPNNGPERGPEITQVGG